MHNHHNNSESLLYTTSRDVWKVYRPHQITKVASPEVFHTKQHTQITTTERDIHRHRCALSQHKRIPAPSVYMRSLSLSYHRSLQRPGKTQHTKDALPLSPCIALPRNARQLNKHSHKHHNVQDGSAHRHIAHHIAIVRQYTPKSPYRCSRHTSHQADIT